MNVKFWLEFCKVYICFKDKSKILKLVRCVFWDFMRILIFRVKFGIYSNRFYNILVKFVSYVNYVVIFLVILYGGRYM